MYLVHVSTQRLFSTQDLGPEHKNGHSGPWSSMQKWPDCGPRSNNTHLAPKCTQDPGPGDNNKDSGPRS